MPAKSYPHLRSAVRALRIKVGLTQEQLAESADLDYKYYQRFELGGTPLPTLSTVARLARVLGVRPWVLLCDDEAMVLEYAGLTTLERRTSAKPGRPRKAR